MNAGQLHIIVTHFNPNRVAAHKRLRQEFLARYADCGAPIYVVELALGDRPFEVAESGNPRHLQIRSNEEVPWIKENLFNIARRRLLPHDAKYIALIDGDIQFMNPNWATDTLNELQHAPVVQMFSECMDCGPSHQAVAHERSKDDFVRYSFAKLHVQRGRNWTPGSGYDSEHCGYAWAFRNSVLNELDPFNPLIDYSLLGSADWMMACCFIGSLVKAIHGQATDSYKRRVALFYRRCEIAVKRDLSYIPGLVVHEWHGRKRDRGYMSRWNIVVDEKFDPDLDLKYRADGLLVFSGHNPRLPLLLRDHQRAKNEDSIDTN
jgi:hypothetical protein